MFTKLLKIFLIGLGFLLIGFGIGIIIGENFELTKNQYVLITIGALILGGFITALGIVKRASKKKKLSEPLKPSYSDIEEESESDSEQDSEQENI